MSATLDKDMPITFSICSETAIPSLESIAKTKPSVMDTIPTIDVLREALAIVKEELNKAVKKMIKRYPKYKEHRMDHLLAVEILTSIFKDHWERGTSPGESIDHILNTMDVIWEEIKNGG